jgi:upstream activation factor subunit UAF30
LTLTSSLTLKDAITALILQRFDIFTAREAAENAAMPSTKTNGATNSNGKRTSPSDSSTASPSPKKRKPGQSVQETDAAYAARLQAEENGRARSTRGAGTKRKAPSKKEKRKKKKSKTVVGTDDDSDAGTPEEKVIKNTGFHVGFASTLPYNGLRGCWLTSYEQKPMALSPPLAELLGQSTVKFPGLDKFLLITHF